MSSEVILGTASSLKAYSIGLIFQMIVLVFANYIQCFGHNIIPVIVYFISNVLLVLFGAAYGGTIARFGGYNAATGIFAGVSIRERSISRSTRTEITAVIWESG